MNTITLTQAEGDDFSTANDFRQVGLLLDPTTYGTSTIASSSTARQTFVVKLDTSSGTFEADEQITQATTGAVGKVVEWDSTLKLLYFQQERFSGFAYPDVKVKVLLFASVTVSVVPAVVPVAPEVPPVI